MLVPHECAECRNGDHEQGNELAIGKYRIVDPNTKRVVKPQIWLCEDHLIAFDYDGYLVTKLQEI